MIISIGIKFKKEEKIVVECDFKVSPKCLGQYLKLYKNILKGRENNNGKDRCHYCANSLTKTGKNNFNFKYEKNEDFFQEIDSELKAYLLGWVAGDGCLKKDGLFLEIHKNDIEILELFKKSISPSSLFYNHSDPIRGANTICWKTHSVKIVKDLIKHLNLASFGKKSYNISFPKIEEKLIIHFIRGLVDSDGSIFDPKKIKIPMCNYCSMSSMIRNQLILFCNKNNIKCYCPKYSVNFRGKNALAFMELIYENSTYALTRKKNMFMIWKTWIPYHGTIINR